MVGELDTVSPTRYVHLDVFLGDAAGCGLPVCLAEIPSSQPKKAYRAAGSDEQAARILKTSSARRMFVGEATRRRWLRGIMIDIE